MEKVEEDMVLAYSLRRHGLESWEMVAAEFSNSISDRRRCILLFSSMECQVKYESLKERFKSLYQIDFTEEEDDDSGFIKLMTDKLTKTYRDYWTEQVKLMDTPLREKSPNIFKQEAEERIKLNEEKSDDKSNEKMENINQEFIKILDVVRSHKHCCLFESRLPSQEDLYYFKQIKQHMDLQIIRNKLEQNVYSVLEIDSFFRDLLLIFNNAIVYYPNETLQYSVALELRDIIVREMGKKSLCCREIVCGLLAACNPMLAKQKIEKRAYNARNKAQEGESSVRKSARVRNKIDCEFKNDPDYDCKGQQRRTTKKK
ncbi:hypothetical protein MTR67_000737 [Solanum verrucosum]|uniref:Bromo domain-containing protein n=1 Tax=Solanum verrucosum TaxID=315347 RepID=A0AAF0PMZ6_SOLVR|nr:hypothetical protein MTR67_000737 [Solanum verrucosum]